MALLLAAGLCAPPAAAVVLDPRGSGQVLLFPYYTVNGGNATLVEIGNGSAAGKALKVTFREGRNQRPVLSFNLYLAPYDVWTGALFALEPEGPANLVTDDTSCTVPHIRTATSLPQLADGRRYVALRHFAYSGFNSDGGPTTPARTREGAIEVIEMGELVPDSPAARAIAHRSGAPADCELPTRRHLPGGLWSTNPATELRNPGGGVFGSAAIVDVSGGTMLSYAPEALAGFREDPLDVPRGSTSSVVLHTGPGDERPNLADALSDPARNVASATVIVDGRPIRADYPAGTQGIDAVSAVLMASAVANDFVTDPAIGASTEWILAFPTRAFYADPATRSVAVPPFRALHSGAARPGQRGGPCPELRYELFDRAAAGDGSECNQCVVGLLPPGSPPESTQLCYAVQALDLNQEAHGNTIDFLVSSLRVPLTPYALPAGSRDGSGFSATSGWMRIELADSRDAGAAAQMRPALDGTVFEGLPVTGFAAMRFVNAQAQPGLLANYGGAFRHRTTVRCTRNGEPCR